MLFIRDQPVAVVGATRWYAAPQLAELSQREQETVAAVCRLLLERRAASGGSSRANAENP